MLKTKSTIALAAVLCLLLLVAFSASSCDTGDTPGGTNVTDSRSAVSNGAIDCNHVQYKQACQEVKRRYEYMNDANKYGYFYGFVQGVDHPVIEYVVQGGVFPNSDLVSNPNYQEQCISGGSQCSVVLDKQQPDGTYGTNGNAMFGWTADGNYFEWDGPYAYAAQPLSFEGHVKVVGCKAGVPGC